MSELTAFNFGVLGLSLLLLYINKISQKYWIGAICSTLVLAISLVAIVGYVMHIDDQAGFLLYTRVSIPTSIGFVASSLSLCFKTLLLSKNRLLYLRLVVLVTLTLLFTTLLLWRGFEINALFSNPDRDRTSFNPIFLSFFTLVILILLTSAFIFSQIESEFKTITSRFKMVLDNTQLSISDWNEDCSSKFICTLYYDSIKLPNPSETSFDQWLRNIHEEDRTQVYKQFEEFLADPSKEFSFTARILTTDNQILWVRGFGQPIENPSSDKVSKFVLVLKDVTQDRQYSHRFKAFGDLLNSLSDAVIGITPDFMITDCNRSAETLMGDNADKLKDSLLFDLLEPSKNEIIARAKENSEEKFNTPFLVESINCDGCKIIISMKMSPVLNFNGQIEGYSLLCQDKTREQQLLKKEKEVSELRQHLMTVVSHEMRDPVTVIKESIESLLESSQEQLDSEKKELLQIAENNIEKLSHIIHETLDHQMLELGGNNFSKSMEDLNIIIQETSSELKQAIEEKNLQLELNLAENLPKCYIDKCKITKVLLNLLSNAMKFTNQGTIKISTSCGPTEISCSIEDTGEGIDKKNQGTLFEMFSESHKQKAHFGAGLGLSLVKKILDLHSGRIEVHSEVGKGSTFTFTLPLPKGDRLNK